MEELAKLEDERGTPGYVQIDGRRGKGRSRNTLRAKDAQVPTFAESTGERVASNEMCTFLILNISSLQLIPVNMIV